MHHHALRRSFWSLSDDSGESTIRAMDEAGIDHRIVLILDWGLELGKPELSIEAIHEAVMGICQRFPDRFTGFAGLDPRRREAAELLGWAVDSLGARGLKLHPTSEGWTLHDESTLRLVEIAAQRSLPVLVHVGATFPVLTDRNAGPRSLLAMAALFPQTTFVAGHAGFKRWREFRSDGHFPPNVLLDVSGWQSLDDGGETLPRSFAKSSVLSPDRSSSGPTVRSSGCPRAAPRRTGSSAYAELSANPEHQKTARSSPFRC